MSSSLDLTSLATETANTLSKLWDTMGVGAEERAAYLDALAQDVAAIYSARVDAQCTRQATLEAEITQLQTTIANMITAMEETSSSVPQSGDAPLIAYRDTLEFARAGLQEIWDARYSELKSFESTLYQLYTDVGAECEPSFTSIGDKMSLYRMECYTNEIQRVQAIKFERTNAITSLCEEITALRGELGFSTSSTTSSSSYPAATDDQYDAFILPPANGTGLGWTMDVISLLQEKANTLQAEKSMREERIMIIGQQITALWKRLGTPEDEQTTFLEAHAGIGDDVIQACETYLATKQIEFAGRLVDLIGGARMTITSLWNELRWAQGGQERLAHFPLYTAGVEDYTDDLFLKHEQYITSLQALLEDVRPLLKNIEKREAILKDKAEYEALMADPQRLLAKGSSSARLREEKLERRVKKELPLVNKKIRQMCVEYEAAHGGGGGGGVTTTTFNVDGVRYIDVIDSEEAAETKAREDARHKRENRTAGGGNEENHASGSTTSSSSSVNNHGTTAHLCSTTTNTGGALRSTSAPGASIRASVYRPNVLNATGAGAAAAKPKLPNVIKKTSVPAASSSSSASVVFDSNANDDTCTIVSGVTTTTEAYNTSVAVTKPVVAVPPPAAPPSNALKPRAVNSTVTSSSKTASGPKSGGTLGKTFSSASLLSSTHSTIGSSSSSAEASVSDEVRATAAAMAQAL